MRNQSRPLHLSSRWSLMHNRPYLTPLVVAALRSAQQNPLEQVDSSASKPTRSMQMTHYGPSLVTTIGLSNDLNKITLWLRRSNGISLSKELNADDATELATRLLREASALRQRGMHREV